MDAGTIAGILLVAGPSLSIGWNAGLLVSGRMVTNVPPTEWPALAGTMRRTVTVWIASWVLGVGGFAVLVTAIDDDRGLSMLALVLLVVALVFVILEGTHHLAVGIPSASAPAAGEAAARVIAPWAGRAFQTVFYTLGMAGLGAYGAAVVVSDALPVWPGWIAVAVAVAGLALLRHRGRLTWALVVPAQLAIGIALLVA